MEKVIKIIKYLTPIEWMSLTLAIVLNITLPIVLGLVDSELKTTSYVLAIVATTFALFGGFFGAKGRKIGILFDVIAVTCNGLNLIIFAGANTQSMIGYALMLFVIPCLLMAPYFWNKRTFNGVVKGKDLKLKGWITIILIWLAISMMIFIIRYSTGGFNDLEPLRWVNLFFECLATGSIFIGAPLYVFTYKEAWTWWIMGILLNTIIFSTNYFIEPNPNALIIMVSLSIDGLLAVYGLMRWKQNITQHEAAINKNNL